MYIPMYASPHAMPWNSVGICHEFIKKEKKRRIKLYCISCPGLRYQLYAISTI